MGRQPPRRQYPQCGHVSAVLETLFLHSGQGLSIVNVSAARRRIDSAPFMLSATGKKVKQRRFPSLTKSHAVVGCVKHGCVEVSRPRHRRERRSPVSGVGCSRSPGDRRSGPGRGLETRAQQRSGRVRETHHKLHMCHVNGMARFTHPTVACLSGTGRWTRICTSPDRRPRTMSRCGPSHGVRSRCAGPAPTGVDSWGSLTSSRSWNSSIGGGR
jgi:hypothetical protein